MKGVVLLVVVTCVVVTGFDLNDVVYAWNGGYGKPYTDQYGIQYQAVSIPTKVGYEAR